MAEFRPDVFRATAAQKLCDMGIIPETVISEDDPPFIAAFINYIATATSQESANIKLLTLTEFIGQVANQLKWFAANGQYLSDALIEVYVSNAATRTNLDDGTIVRATQSCLNDCHQADRAMESVIYRMGNLLVALGAIAETANDIDRTLDPS